MEAKKREVKKYVVPFFVSYFSYCSVLPWANKFAQLEKENHWQRLRHAQKSEAGGEIAFDMAKKLQFQEWSMIRLTINGEIYP